MVKKKHINIKQEGKKYLFKSFYGNIPECNVNKISFNL